MIIIRKSTIKDLEAIQALNRKLFLYEKKFNKTYNENWPYETPGEKYFKSRVGNVHNSVCLVAEYNKQIVGYLTGFIDTYSYRKINPIAELENIFVLKSYRAEGIGGLLFEDFKELSKEIGAKRLRVRVFAKNKPAVKFYKKHGFASQETILEEDL